MISELVIAGGGDGMVHQLLMFLLIGICVGLIYWVGKWFIGSVGAPPMASKVWDGLFILIGLIVIINFLLGLAGHPLFRG
jgi:hypothetical protein